MPRALLAWEFGGDLGHARRAVVIARQLRSLGHETAFAFSDLGALDAADAISIPCVPAPLLPLAAPLDPSPLNISHVLLNLGYGDPAALAGALAAWKSVIGLMQPDAIVCDYAPTALLAGRATDLPCIAIGSGFSLPPLADPMPSLRSWMPSEPAQLAKLDAHLLASVRSAWVSVHAGRAPPARASDLFAADAQLVCAWPELDPYGAREDVEYMGPQRDTGKAQAVGWRTEARPRVFAYLKPRDPRFQAILEGIGRMAGEAIVAAPGVSEPGERSFLDGRLRVLPAAVDVEAMADADLWVSHGSAGIVAAAMRLGVPHALLPLQLEQYLVARRAAENGVARYLDPAEANSDLAKYLASVIADEAIARAVAQSRARIASRVPTSVGERIARALHAKGHSIAFMLRDLKPVPMVAEAQGYDVFQAPRSPREAAASDIPASYAEILLGCGWRDPRELTALLAGWRNLLSRWDADLLVADFAPTALLAAATLGMKRVTFGNGFFTPPRLSPLPAFRVDTPVDPARIAGSDAQARTQANAALAGFGAPALARLADAFEAHEDFLCTFPELDHYDSRPVSGYWGPRLRNDLGNPIDWPEGQGKRVLVYLQRDLPQLDAFIEVLAASPHRVIAYIPGLDDARRARLAGRGRVVIDRPHRLDQVLPRCDLLVCHGGEIAGGAVASGVPVLFFPSWYEQYLAARRVERLGAGGWFGPDAAAKDVQVGLATMTSDPRFAQNARAFAQRYKSWSPQEQRQRIVGRIEQLLA